MGSVQDISEEIIKILDFNLPSLCSFWTFSLFSKQNFISIFINLPRCSKFISIK